MDYIALGHKVNHLRKQKNLTQEKLAELIGISPSFLGHIERGSRKASLETFVRIVNALNVDAGFLLSDSLRVYHPSNDEREAHRRKLLAELLHVLYEQVDSFPLY